MWYIYSVYKYINSNLNEFDNCLIIIKQLFLNIVLFIINVYIYIYIYIYIH